MRQKGSALAAGETQTDVARSYGVSYVTIGRLQGPVLRPFDGGASSRHEALNYATETQLKCCVPAR
jgi:hypothetical protein